jgi:hypothetical protein
MVIGSVRLYYSQRQYRSKEKEDFTHESPPQEQDASRWPWMPVPM